MEEKKNRFFDLDTQEQIDNPDAKKVEEKSVTTDNTFSKIFGGGVEEVKKEEVQEPKGPSTFENVFKTSLTEKKEESVPVQSSSPKGSSQANFSDIFQTELTKEKKPVPVKKEGIPTNSSKFFNAEQKVDETVPTIKTEEETIEYVQKVGDNPMVDYERINREAKENAPIDEEEVEIEKEDVIQSNNTIAKRVNMGGSDLMKLRMQRR